MEQAPTSVARRTSLRSRAHLLIQIIGWYFVASAVVGFLYLDWSTLTGYTYAYYYQITFLLKLTPIPLLALCNGSGCEAGGGGFAFLLADFIVAIIGIVSVALGRRK